MRRVRIETTLLRGLMQRQRETREVNMAQDLSLWSPRRETVMEKERGSNNSETLEGRGRYRKGRKLSCVLTILLQAWLQEYSGSRTLKNVKNQCCARQWRNARNETSASFNMVSPPEIWIGEMSAEWLGGEEVQARRFPSAKAIYCEQGSSLCCQDARMPCRMGKGNGKAEWLLTREKKNLRY